jgi:hypothetical protein
VDTSAPYITVLSLSLQSIPEEADPFDAWLPPGARPPDAPLPMPACPMFSRCCQLASPRLTRCRQPAHLSAHHSPAHLTPGARLMPAHLAACPHPQRPSAPGLRKAILHVGEVSFCTWPMDPSVYYTLARRSSIGDNLSHGDVQDSLAVG